MSFELNNQKIERLNLGIEQARNDQTYTLSPTIGYSLDIRTEISYSRSSISKPLYYAYLGKFLLNRWKLLLERNWAIGKITNLNTNISLTRRTTTAAQLPYDINLFEPTGLTPEVKVNVDHIFQSGASNAFNQIILGATYSFLKYPARAAEHNFSLKLQANF
jgi:hypothetical protein